MNLLKKLKSKFAPKSTGRILIKFTKQGDRITNEIKIDHSVNCNEALKVLEQMTGTISKAVTEKVKSVGLNKPGKAQREYVADLIIKDIL